MLNEYLSKVFHSFSNLIKHFLASFIKDKKMVKIHRFEHRLTKKITKTGFKQKRLETIISFGIKPMNSILGRSKGIEPSNDRFTAGCVNRFTTTAIARLIINGIALKSKEKFLRLKELSFSVRQI